MLVFNVLVRRVLVFYGSALLRDASRATHKPALASASPAQGHFSEPSLENWRNFHNVGHLNLNHNIIGGKNSLIIRKDIIVIT